MNFIFSVGGIAPLRAPFLMGPQLELHMDNHYIYRLLYQYQSELYIISDFLQHICNIMPAIAFI